MNNKSNPNFLPEKSYMEIMKEKKLADKKRFDEIMGALSLEDKLLIYRVLGVSTLPPWCRY